MDYDQLLDGCSEVGLHMLAAGAEIYRVEDTVCRLLGAYGVQGEVFAIPNCLIVSIDDDRGRSHTRMRRVNSAASTNIEIIERFNALSRRICAQLPPVERLASLAEETAAGCRQFTLPAVLAGYFLGSFFFTFLFHGGMTDALVGGLAGALAGLSAVGMDRLMVNYFFKTIAAAAVLGMVVYGIRCIGIPIDTGVTVIGALMALVPGLVFTNFMCDLLTGDALAGTSTFIRAILTASAIALGTGVVLWLFQWLGLPVDGAERGAVYHPVFQCAAAFAACGGYALVYNAHGAAGIVLCSLGGALGWAVDLAVELAGGSHYLSCFAAAVAITIYAEIMARRRKCPATAYLVISYFPLVPGTYIYYAMYYAIQGERQLFLESGILAVGMAASIAMGTLLVTTIVRTYAIWRGRRRG